MPDKLFANSSLDTLSRRPRPYRDEPEFSLRDMPPAPDPFSGTEGEGRMRATSPPDAVRSRARGTASELPVGSLLYLILLGFVAVATIGVFFGAGFLLLAHPEMHTTADPGARGRAPPPPYSGAPQADREAPPLWQELAAPDPPAAANLPASPPAPRAPVVETPASGQSKATQDTPPVPPSAEPPARTVSEIATASNSAVPPSPMAPSASPVPSAAEDAAPAGAKHRQAHRGQRNHARSALRHAYPPPSGGAQSLTPPQYPAARYLAPPRTGQAGSFDRLLGQLTGPSKPAAGSLTPPGDQ